RACHGSSSSAPPSRLRRTAGARNIRAAVAETRPAVATNTKMQTTALLRGMIARLGAALAHCGTPARTTTEPQSGRSTAPGGRRQDGRDDGERMKAANGQRRFRAKSFEGQATFLQSPTLAKLVDGRCVPFSPPSSGWTKLPTCLKTVPLAVRR